MKIPKNLISFLSIFAFVAVFLAVGVEAFFYEDEVYFLMMKSIIQDFDYNLINQVSEEKQWLVTKEYFFPSHHSEIQTPIIFLSYLFESVIRMILPSSIIKNGIMSGHIVSFLCLAIGFVYVKKLINLFDIEFDLKIFLVFLLGTSLFYFSFLTVTAIEIISFTLTSFTLFMAFKLKDRNYNDYAFLGISSSLLLISKFYFLSLYVLVIFKIWQEREKTTRKCFASFTIGSLLVFIPGLLNHYIKYGEFFFWAGSFADSVLLYSWDNFKVTIKNGYFGVGGLFYTNPVLLPSIIGLILWGIEQLKNRKYVFETFIIGAWLVQGLFSPVFLAGELVEDHYVGRTFFTVLPIYLLGLGYILKFVKGNAVKAWLAVSFILWQAFHTLSYLKISRTGHYSYSTKKLISLEELIQFCEELRVIITTNIVSDYGVYISFCLIISGIVYYVLYKFNEKYMKAILAYSLIFLFVASILNMYYGKINGEQYFADKKRYENVSIGGHPDTYYFIYVLDILNTQEIATNNQAVRTSIHKMRHNYYDKIKDKFLKKSDKLENELIQRSFKNSSFNYYLREDEGQ